MEGVKFEFYKGRTYIRDFTIKGWTPEINQVYFTIKENVTDKNYKLQKTLDDDIVCTKKYEENGMQCREYNLKINATDTDNLDINKNYVFDIAIISGNVKQTITTGILRLLGTATHTHNEKGGI